MNEHNLRRTDARDRLVLGGRQAVRRHCYFTGDLRNWTRRELSAVNFRVTCLERHWMELPAHCTPETKHTADGGVCGSCGEWSPPLPLAQFNPFVDGSSTDDSDDDTTVYFSGMFWLSF